MRSSAAISLAGLPGWMPKCSVSWKAASTAWGPSVLIRYEMSLPAGGATAGCEGSALTTETVNCVAESTDTIS